ncbi:hypothetical protein O7632_18350 [Solwaraspora sp. WMMD406]|uniref:hypothetical protein n=1 Tax=Solwaraspora sp. WMMD406 TaxID=3016095 RepID=UPI002415BC67|nr:hypothetical protein [Solwaraspora sp. WMMD406]MDG4766048.1 hypothetical protein [Solwaraspora sp. WMMD406]
MSRNAVSEPSSTGAPAPTPPGSSSGPGGLSRRSWLVIGLVAALLVAATIVAVVVEAVGRDRGPAGDPAIAWTVQAPLADRTEVALEVLDGATDIRVVVEDVQDDLLRARTPQGGAVAPRISDDGDLVQVGLDDTGNGGAGVVEIALHPDVLWSIRVLGGATTQQVDLSGARVSAVELAGGASTMDLMLPQPQGTVTVRMTGGVSTWRIELPARVPVQVRVGSGAGSVSVDGERRDGIGGGETISSPDWAEATDRYDVDAAAGFSDLTVTRAD